MAEIYKTFDITLDISKPVTNQPFEVVDGDTGNVIEIEVLDNGVAVDLSEAQVFLIFAHSGITVEQDTETVGGDVTIGGTDDNIITVKLHSSSYAPKGITECEIKIVSGATGAVYITTPLFNINSRRALLSDDTITSVTEFPIFVEYIQRLENLEDREQADWTETDTQKGSYIQHKPVAGTDFCDAIPNLTAETTLATTDTIPFYDASATAHRKTTWANLVQKIFGSITGLVKADGAGNISAAVANTDYAAATHASRHASGAADAVTPAAIGAEKEHLEFLDQAVSTSGWATYTASGTEETAIQNLLYTYRKTITLSGVTTGYTGTVSPRAAYESCGTQVYRRCQTLTDGIYLYAKATPTGAFTIDVFIRKGVG